MKQLLSVLAALALLGAPAQAVTEADFASCGAYDFGFIRAEACIDALDGDYTLNLGPTTVPFGPYQLREQAEYEVFGSLLTVEVNSNVRAFTGLSVFSQAQSFQPEALRISGFGELSAGVNAVFGGFKAELPEELEEQLPCARPTGPKPISTSNSIRGGRPRPPLFSRWGMSNNDVNRLYEKLDRLDRTVNKNTAEIAKIVVSMEPIKAFFSDNGSKKLVIMQHELEDVKEYQKNLQEEARLTRSAVEGEERGALLQGKTAKQIALWGGIGSLAILAIQLLASWLGKSLGL